MVVTENVNVEILENAHTLYITSERWNNETCTGLS